MIEHLAFVLLLALLTVVVGVAFGLLVDRIAFGGWKSHSPFQFHYRRAAVILFALASFVYLVAHWA